MPRTLTEQEFTAIRDKVLASMPANLSEAEYNRLVPSTLDGAIAEAENLPKPLDGSALTRYVSNLGSMLNPVAIAKGLGSLAHPINTAQGIFAGSVDEATRAKNAAAQGRYLEAIGHAGGAIPVLGKAAADAGEQIAEGDIAGGLGKATGLLLPVAGPSAARAAGRALQAAPESAAAAAEAGAAARVAGVMAPKIGANKVRFGGMAEDVAPAVAKDLAAEGAPWTREGLHARIGGKLAEAEAALDAAQDARLGARTFPTKPILDGLLEKRRALTSEAVDASQFTPQSGVNRPPLGEDVVPAPNAARVAQIDQAIEEVKKLGPVARYESIRRLRQAYDQPAKAVYSPAVTADYLKQQGGAYGAADVTGVLRDTLAQWDPQTAAANSQYALYRRANDVLDATAEVERTRPKVGRQIMARLAGTLAGEQAAGLKGAAAGYVLGPVLDSVASAGATTQLKTAALLQGLANAIRGGQIGSAESLASQIRRVSASAAATVGNGTIRVVGLETTSPSGSPTTTAPATP